VYLYECRYWSEGPGRSHVEVVLVAAKNKKAAIDYINTRYGVYKADRDLTSAKRAGSTNAVFVKYLREE
jgi:hypothetical protein